MLPEYLYGGLVRWNFGFENPNKAAVLFACVLPLCWLGWISAWRLDSLRLRIPAVLLTGMMVLGVGGCLLMTYSRGGLVAAVTAMAYQWWMCRNSVGVRGSLHGGSSRWLSLLLLAGLVTGALLCGAVGRSVLVLSHDASVMHRFDLWRGALQMALDNIHGFGAGHSGEQYMEWYQSLDRTECYRTMVNSYLTFLVERGWMYFGFCVFWFSVFWQWTAPRRACRGFLLQVAAALRGSILAFLTAAIFSTTMEDRVLWIIPSCCAILLISLRPLLEEPSIHWKELFGGSLRITAVLLGMLWCTGWWLDHEDALIRFCSNQAGSRAVVSVSSRQPAVLVSFIPDERTCGDLPGRLARALALGANAQVTLPGAVIKKEPKIPQMIVAGGERCFDNFSSKGEMIWIAPSVPTGSEKIALDKNLLTADPEHLPQKILIPDIDEDGRGAWWRRWKEEHPTAVVEIIVLAGVGTRIDWAWDQVIELLKKESVSKMLRT